MDKDSIRKEIKQIRRSMDEKEYQDKSCMIQQAFLASSFFNDATIGIYVSHNHEVDTIELIKQLLDKQCRICVPKVEGKRLMNFYQITSLDQLTRGAYGLMEPNSNILVPKEEIQLMITPLVAFNKELCRIGYGGGYYDTYFDSMEACRIGFAFEFQYKEFIPEKHDKPLNLIITEKNTYFLSNSKRLSIIGNGD